MLDGTSAIARVLRKARATLLACLVCGASACDDERGSVAALLDAGGTPDAAPDAEVDAAVPAMDAGSDAGADAGRLPPTKAEYQACERELSEQWSEGPVAVGLGSSAAREAYTRVIGGLMREFEIPGGAVAVTRSGRLVLALGLGLADIADAQPVQPASLFRIASLSKQVTALALLTLAEQQGLDLDAKAFAMLGEIEPAPNTTPNAALDDITVRHLLQHRGGWNRDKESAGDPMFDSADIASAVYVARPAGCDTIIRYMLGRTLTYAPGTTMCYSNFGYCVLGRVVERASGMSYEDYVREALLRPAGIEHMQLGRSLLEDRAEGEVRYYDYEDAPLATSVFPGSARVAWPYGGFYLEAMDAHGGWLASTLDMLRLQATFDGRPSPDDVISSESRTAMLENPEVPVCTATGGSTPASTQRWYGLGVQVNSAGNVWHTGSLPGSATEDVIGSGGFSWSAFFNRRPREADLFARRLDTELWTALSAVDSPQWGPDNVFDQYTRFDDWMDAEAFESARAAHAGEMKHAARLEGRDDGGQLQLRAIWAPLHAGMSPEHEANLDCFDYRTAAAAQEDSGRHIASLQSFVDAAGIRRYQAVWVK